jgi:hypothetical protein
MNAAEFQKGAQDAQNAIDRFGNALGIANLRSKIAIGSLVAIFVAGMVKIGEAINSAIDRGAELVKLSERIGIPFEVLADLAQGANLPVKELGAALVKLQENMADIASGNKTSAAARSLDAMGISVFDLATGKLKPAQEVLMEFADKLASYRDGANKTALAQNVLGDSALALVPVLSEGRDKIEEMAEAARESGEIMDKETAVKAEALKDTIKELGQNADALGNRLLQIVVPTLNAVATKAVELIDSFKLVDTYVAFVDVGFKSLVSSGTILRAVFEAVSAQVANLSSLLKDFFTGNWTEGFKNYNDAQDKLVENARKNVEDLRAIWTGPEGVKKAVEDTTDAIVKSEAPTITSIKSITDAQREWNKAVQEGVALVKQLRTPLETQERSIYALSAAHKEGKITAEQMAVAQQAAVYTTQAAYANLAGQVGNALTQVFSHSKGVAIASALINTYEAVTKALASYPPPFNYVAAGAALAAGLAQVQKIRSTNKGGGGGGGGGSVSSSGATASQGPQQAPQQLMVQGIKSDHWYSGDSVANLARALVDYQKNGGQVVIQQ